MSQRTFALPSFSEISFGSSLRFARSVRILITTASSYLPTDRTDMAIEQLSYCMQRTMVSEHSAYFFPLIKT
jgi:hypothetical protein